MRFTSREHNMKWPKCLICRLSISSFRNEFEILFIVNVLKYPLNKLIKWKNIFSHPTMPSEVQIYGPDVLLTILTILRHHGTMIWVLNTSHLCKICMNSIGKCNLPLTTRERKSWALVCICLAKEGSTWRSKKTCSKGPEKPPQCHYGGCRSTPMKLT